MFGFVLGLPFIITIFYLSVLQSLAPFQRRNEKILFSFLIVASIFSNILDKGFIKLLDTIAEIIPILIVISSLFIIGNGINIELFFSTNINNLLYFLLGSMLSAVAGTTTSSILLVRPLIKNNSFSAMQAKIVVIFFIIIVSNISGAITPFGDPPLLAGFLKGIPFFWMISNLSVISILLCLFFILVHQGVFFLVSYLENKKPPYILASQKILLNRSGLFLSIFFTLGLSVLLAKYHNIFLKLLCIILIILNSYYSSKDFIQNIDFSPIIELNLILFVIFLSMEPILTILHQKYFSDIIQNLNAFQSFWVTGVLSSILDNTPTFLCMFSLKIKKIPLYNEANIILRNISLAAVFMGCSTYIGNAPNLIVRNIAEKNNVRMPGFLFYTLIVSVIIFPILYFISTNTL